MEVTENSGRVTWLPAGLCRSACKDLLLLGLVSKRPLTAAARAVLLEKFWSIIPIYFPFASIGFVTWLIEEAGEVRLCWRPFFTVTSKSSSYGCLLMTVLASTLPPLSKYPCILTPGFYSVWAWCLGFYCEPRRPLSSLKFREMVGGGEFNTTLLVRS